MESFLIAEKYVPKDTLKKVAKAVLLAQDIREDSWDEMCRYKKTDSESAYEAVNALELDAVWSCVISGWLSFKWNDCQSWAKLILQKC